MGPERNGRVRGKGLGVTPSIFYGRGKAPTPRVASQGQGELLARLANSERRLNWMEKAFATFGLRPEDFSPAAEPDGEEDGDSDTLERVPETEFPEDETVEEAGQRHARDDIEDAGGVNDEVEVSLRKKKETVIHSQ